MQIRLLLEYQLLQTIVKDHIVQILLRYDVSTVQEIRESSGASFPKLVADMNSIAGDIYDFHVGARQASVRYDGVRVRIGIRFITRYYDGELLNLGFRFSKKGHEYFMFFSNI